MFQCAGADDHAAVDRGDHRTRSSDWRWYTGKIECNLRVCEHVGYMSVSREEYILNVEEILRNGEDLGYFIYRLSVKMAW